MRDNNNSGEGMERRVFLTRFATAFGIGAVSSYMAFAPENWPLSLKDPTGKRSHKKIEPFSIKDFRVTPANNFAIGLGRDPDLDKRLRKALDAIGGITHYVKPGDIVLLKPNVAFDRAPEIGATSNPEVIKRLIQILLVDCRAKEVRVVDNPIESPSDCFQKSGISPATIEAGGKVYLPDSNAFKSLSTPGATLIPEWSFFARPFKGVTKVIGVSPIKDHNLCQASMGIKNWYGLLGGARNQFHQNIHEIVSDLSLMIKPTLTVLDGSYILMKNGPTGGDPSNVKRGDVILAGTDPVALDTYAFEFLLERGKNYPAYLKKSEEKGSGSMHYEGRIKEII